MSEAMLFWRYISSSVDQLIATLEGLDTTEINWKPLPTGNSLSVLATHTMGNCADNLLSTLGGQAIPRDRDAEFAAHGESAASIHEKWQQLRSQIQEQLAQIDDATLLEPKPHPRRGTLTGRDILIVVARHSAEHMGQAFLTRDLILAQRPSTTND